MSRPSNRAAQPNIIWRVGMLPLMNSTSQVLLMTYSDVKRTNWLTSTLCNALETSARMATGLAVRRAKPILDVFESQFASVNTFASKRLDKLEEEFPILQLSIDEVAWHLRESLTLTLDNAQECLSEETVKLRARAGALVEEMWALISCQAAAFLNTGPGQLMAARGDGWLRWLGEMVDRHLPDSADDCILEDAGVCGFERDIPVEPGLYLRVQRLTLKVHSRLYQRVLLYSQRAQEVALTDILLLMELFDWLRASWAFSVLDRSFQSLLGLSVSVTGHLAGLQAMLLGCLSEAARIVSSAWSVGLSFGGHSFRLGLQLLSQLSELATLLVLFLINILNALLFDLEEEGEDSGTLDSESDESQDGRGRWGVGPRASDLPSCISEDDLRKLLEHAGSRRRSLVRGADPHDAYQPHYSPGPSQSRWEGAGRRRSSESWAVPPQVERSDPLPALRRASADQGQIPGRRASHGTQSRGYRPSSHHM